MSDAKPGEEKKILLFDGLCNLCTGLVIFVIKRDKDGKIRFGSLQSDEGKEYLKRLGLRHEKIQTFVLIEKDNYFLKSDAALRLFRTLDGFWPCLYFLIIVPKSVRDFVYSFIAGRRYEWFGRKRECMVPSPDLKNRFLEQTFSEQ